MDRNTRWLYHLKNYTEELEDRIKALESLHAEEPPSESPQVYEGWAITSSVCPDVVHSIYRRSADALEDLPFRGGVIVPIEFTITPRKP